MMRTLFAMMLLVVSGCAHYEYNVVEPPELARHIPTKSLQVLPRAPLDYQLQTYDNRLVMMIGNPTDQDVTLLGDRSVVVDPAGESHPLPSQTIASHSHIKLIPPPPRPEVYPYGPTFGFGVTHVGSAHDVHCHPRSRADDPSSSPLYLSTYGID